jgi:hypothetical protein
MKPVQRIHLLALLYSHTQAAMVSILPGQFADTSLDVDSDGHAEFQLFDAQSGGDPYPIKVNGMALDPM